MSMFRKLGASKYIYIYVVPRNVYAILENTQTPLSSKVKCSLLFKYNALYSANIPVN